MIENLAKIWYFQKMKAYFHAVMFARIMLTCVIDFFCEFVIFWKISFYTYYEKFVLGKKLLQFYFFGNEGNIISHAVTNSVQKVFFCRYAPIFASVYFMEKNWKNILKFFNCAMNLITLWRHSMTTQQMYPVQARGGGGAKTFC